MDHGNCDRNKRWRPMRLSSSSFTFKAISSRADSEADAIARFFRGEGKQELTSMDYAGISNDYGLSLAERPDLASELMDRGVINGDDIFVPSIRSIREAGEEDQRRDNMNEDRATDIHDVKPSSLSHLIGNDHVRQQVQVASRLVLRGPSPLSRHVAFWPPRTWESRLLRMSSARNSPLNSTRPLGKRSVDPPK